MKSLTSSARSSVSSGGSIVACGASRRRESRSGTRSAPEIREPTRAVSSRSRRFALIAFIGGTAPASSRGSAVAILDDQRTARDQMRHVRLGNLARPARSRHGRPWPRSPRDGSCRAPSGPTRRSQASGQCGQASTSHRPASFDGPIRKSSTPWRLSTGRSKASWRGGAGSGMVRHRPRYACGSRRTSRHRRHDRCCWQDTAGARSGTSTPMTAASGTASRRPTKPNSVAEGEQREHQPDRMHADRVADEFRLGGCCLRGTARRQRPPSVASGQVQSGQNCTVATPTDSTSRSASRHRG